MKTLTYNEWVEKYKPIEGYNSQTDAIDNLTVFNLAKERGINYVWSILSCDNEEQYIVPGLCVVNREGYILCEIPWESEDMQVNDNEMCTIEKAIDYCINFAKEHLKITLDRFNVNNYFLNNIKSTFNNEITIGQAKYVAVDYYDYVLNVDIDDIEDEIHNYYSQIN